VHVPVEQLSHAPEQALLQQVPSTQLPELHWLTCMHADPLGNLQSMSWFAPHVA
jgi:hypothetical protein